MGSFAQILSEQRILNKFKLHYQINSLERLAELRQNIYGCLINILTFTLLKRCFTSFRLTIYIDLRISNIYSISIPYTCTLTKRFHSYEFTHTFKLIQPVLLSNTSNMLSVNNLSALVEIRNPRRLSALVVIRNPVDFYGDRDAP